MSEPQARPPAGTALGLEPCTRLAHARPSQSRSGTRGWKALDSSTGFRLPDDSVLSPDASLVALDRWQALSAYQRNCARLGWLLIPAERTVEIWEAARGAGGKGFRSFAPHRPVLVCAAAAPAGRANEPLRWLEGGGSSRRRHQHRVLNDTRWLGEMPESTDGSRRWPRFTGSRAAD